MALAQSVAAVTLHSLAARDADVSGISSPTRDTTANYAFAASEGEGVSIFDMIPGNSSNTHLLPLLENNATGGMPPAGAVDYSEAPSSLEVGSIGAKMSEY